MGRGWWGRDRGLNSGWSWGWTWSISSRRCCRCGGERAVAGRVGIAAGDVPPVDGEPEGAALSGLALDPDGAVVGFDDALDAGEADALARDVLGGVAAAAEDDEDAAEVLGVDADAGVLDVELRLVALDRAAEADLLDGAVAHVLDGVVDQVLEDLAEAGLLAVELRERGLDRQVDALALEVV